MSNIFNLKRYLYAQEYFQPLPTKEKLSEQELINRYDEEYSKNDINIKNNSKLNKANPINQKKLFRAYVFFSDNKREPIDGTWVQAYSPIQARKIVMDRNDIGSNNLIKWESYDDSIVVGVKFIEEKKK